MEFFIDLLPALPFLLVAFNVVDIFTATALAMGAACIQLVLSRLYYGHMKKMHLATFAAIIIFGAITLLLHDPFFVKMKPTALNWGFALVFLGAPLMFKTNLLKMMLGEKIAMPDRAWSQLNLIWVGYFALIGALNLYVALNFSDVTWSKFRVFGMYGALLAFIVVQGVFIYRHMLPEPAAAEGAAGDTSAQDKA
jgi:intracellular septation protein